MTNKEFAGWQAITESSRDRWTEDEIVRLNGRGAMYFIGGEDGAYMRIGKDGTLEVGSYEGAIPHIGEAFFDVISTERLGDYSAAFARALELGGKKFLVDMFSAPNQDELVKAAWARVDAEAAEPAPVNAASVAELDEHAAETDAETTPPVYKLTQADMIEYGYDWLGMQPLTQKEALARFDGNQEVLLLYEEGSEGIAESREQIEQFDGIFGFEIPGYVEPEIPEPAEEPACAKSGGKREKAVSHDGVAFGSVGSIVFGRADYRDDKRDDGFTSVLGAIKKGKEAPKPPRKAKDPKQKTKREERDDI